MGRVARFQPSRLTAIGPSLVIFTCALQVTCARVTLIAALAMFVAVRSSLFLRGLAGVAPHVVACRVNSSVPRFPPGRLPAPGGAAVAAGSPTPKPCEIASILPPGSSPAPLADGSLSFRRATQ